MKRKILDFPIQHARLVFVGLAVLTIGLGAAIPSIQIDTDPENAVIRVVDPRTATVFREIPVEEFLEFARTHRNVKPLLFGRLR